MADRRTHTTQYIKTIQELISDCSPEEKIEILLEKVRYWHWSAIDWRNMLERMTKEEVKK